MTAREKRLKQERRWLRMQQRGHLPELILHIVIWGGSCVAAALVWATLHKLGWVKQPVTISWVDIFSFTVAGLVIGEMDWQDQKRKFSVPPPSEDWMAK